ncbi:MAG TPA: methyltransferase domain-containing protein [Ignavibacteriaceae bacterium]|nr:methyltransferase domain-containing protein [Ignavibacteriaceae bacterium]
MNILKIAYLIIPPFIWKVGKKYYWKYKSKIYLQEGRPFVAAETTKAKSRRMREGFYDKYVQGKGLDIGYGGDKLVDNEDIWDFEHGDAQFLNGVEDNKYDFVYSSHTLEHMVDAEEAIKNWFRVVKPGGYLLLYIPHRDLYEKKKTLPSRFNKDHKHFFLPYNDEAPDTIGIETLIKRVLKNYEIIYIKECKEGFESVSPEKHGKGEFSIEAVIKKI